jgi:hypothetical protein
MKACHKTLWFGILFFNIHFKDFGFTLECPYRHIAQHVGIKNNKIEANQLWANTCVSDAMLTKGIA